MHKYLCVSVCLLLKASIDYSFKDLLNKFMKVLYVTQMKIQKMEIIYPVIN